LADYTQDNRLLQVDTPLGNNVLLLRDLVGTESISHLFHFHLEMLSTDSSIDYKKIVGQKISVTIQLPKNKKRYISGYVSQFSQSHSADHFSHYEAEVVPWLWFLSRTADCRIFQDKNVQDIVTQIFQDLGFQDFKFSLQSSYQPLVYCVQYRESDFNFISRLLEQHGIFYYFEHEKDKHTLILADAPSIHKPCIEQASARMDFSAGAQLKDEDVIFGWAMEQELRPGKYALMDYNFETPNTNLLTQETTLYNVGGNDNYEIYDYPGEYSKKGSGESITKVRMQEEETTHAKASGSSSCRSFAAGYRFNLLGHSRSDLNKAYLLIDVQHSATVGESYTGSADGAEGHYSNHFTCIPFTVPFRPQRTTPKPFVQGPQTAVVVGPSGEEIYTDKYGRVKVQFFWDREGEQDENSSCWVRVSQPWAGKNWGALNIPRIGQEVIVEFLEGDPDRPIITGRVYNAEQMPPYTLPDNMTRTTFMSRSTQGGTSSNYNEFRIEDKTGSEQVFIHAEKDMDVRVKNDSREFVGNDRSLIVKGDQKEEVDGEQHIQITNDQCEKVGGDASLNVTGNENVQIGQNMSLQVGQNLQEKSGQNFAHEAGMEIHLKAGMNIVIEAGMELTIKASGSFINIGPSGVAISGPMVLINSGGAAGSGSGSSPQSPKDPKAPDEADDGSKGGKM
jgi:type VI secretion system secreted protein VgrG